MGPVPTVGFEEASLGRDKPKRIRAPFAASRVGDELAPLALDPAPGDAQADVSLDKADAIIEGLRLVLPL